jgi:hypothetical protein
MLKCTWFTAFVKRELELNELDASGAVVGRLYGTFADSAPRVGNRLLTCDVI